MAAQILSAIITIIVGVGGAVGYFWGANRLLDMIFPSRGVAGAAAIDNLRRQGLIRPWLFIGPALIILTVYLIYPVVADALALLPRPQRRGFRRPRQLCMGLRRPRIPATRSSTICCGWPSCRRPAPSSGWSSRC